MSGPGLLVALVVDGELGKDGLMNEVWNPVSFTAGPLGMFEAVYMEDDGRLVKTPIIGVLIEEKMTIGAAGTFVGSGVTRSVMAKQLESGSADVEAASGGAACVGVFEVGQDPTDELLQRTRAALAAAHERYTAFEEHLAAEDQT
jgi:hypothetical protein